MCSVGLDSEEPRRVTRLRRSNQTAKASRPSPTTADAIPMPAFAPVERPEEDSKSELTEDPVGAAGAVTVTGPESVIDDAAVLDSVLDEVVVVVKKELSDDSMATAIGCPHMVTGPVTASP